MPGPSGDAGVPGPSVPARWGRGPSGPTDSKSALRARAREPGKHLARSAWSALRTIAPLRPETDSEKCLGPAMTEPGLIDAGEPGDALAESSSGAREFPRGFCPRLPRLVRLGFGHGLVRAEDAALVEPA